MIKGLQEAQTKCNFFLLFNISDIDLKEKKQQKNRKNSSTAFLSFLFESILKKLFMQS